MYLYIYDSFLSHKKYENLLIAVEKRVTDLGIKGKVARLSILKNMKELITDGVRDGVQTVVAIGNNQTFTKVINIVADLDVTLGMIPVDNQSSIARILGIPSGIAACEVLASRIIKKIDLGKINTHYFITEAEVINGDVQIEYEDFKITPLSTANKINLYNFACDPAVSLNSRPIDGILETVITPLKKTLFGKKSIDKTILPFTKIKLSSTTDEQVSILIDDQVLVKTPAEIKVVPQKLKVIVGSERQF